MFNDFHCNNFDISRLNRALIYLILKLMILLISNNSDPLVYLIVVINFFLKF
jgi:hypothetical protein